MQIVVSEERTQQNLNPHSESPFLNIAKVVIPISLTSFGGPAAHIALFHETFVVKEKWISDQDFTELFAISQSLPGPASTQLLYSICLLRGGLLCGILGFIIWCFPGMLIMIGFAYGIQQIGDSLPLWLQYTVNGLTAASLGLVALAAFKLATKILINPLAVMIGVLAASFAINFSQPWLYPLLVFGGGFVKILEENVGKFFNQSNEPTGYDDHLQINDHSTKLGYFGWRNGVLILVVWLVFLITAIVLRTISNIVIVNVFSTQYFVGSIIFGGGPVVIPLLQNYVVQGNQWMSNQEFLVGLALINSIPGPNFNMGTFCGALALRSRPELMWIGGIVGLIGIFSPGLLLMTGLVPLWEKYRSIGALQVFFRGVNASAIGLVFAAIYLLGNKSIVPPSSSAGTVDTIARYPLYTSIAAISYSLAGFTPVSAPISIVIGGIAGLCDFATKNS